MACNSEQYRAAFEKFEIFQAISLMPRHVIAQLFLLFPATTLKIKFKRQHTICLRFPCFSKNDHRFGGESPTRREKSFSFSLSRLNQAESQLNWAS